MPELPDVEVNRRHLEATALARPIAGVRVKGPDLLEDNTPQGLGRALKDRAFAATRRHGKLLFAALDGERWLVLHFGMTGRLAFLDQGSGAPDYEQCRIRFSDGSGLAYIAPRRLGRIALTSSPDTYIQRRGLGPDVLGLSQDGFLALASRRRSGVKSWLMSQAVMAGLGNVYSDEVLFQAGIHPRVSVADVDAAVLRRLHGEVHRVLKAAIEAGVMPGRMPPSFLLRHRVEGGHCPRCGARLETLKAAGRTAWICPRCQRR